MMIKRRELGTIIRMYSTNKSLTERPEWSERGTKKKRTPTQREPVPLSKSSLIFITILLVNKWFRFRFQIKTNFHFCLASIRLYLPSFLIRPYVISNRTHAHTYSINYFSFFSILLFVSQQLGMIVHKYAQDAIGIG